MLAGVKSRSSTLLLLLAKCLGSRSSEETAGVLFLLLLDCLFYVTLSSSKCFRISNPAACPSVLHALFCSLCGACGRLRRGALYWGFQGAWFLRGGFRRCCGIHEILRKITSTLRLYPFKERHIRSLSPPLVEEHPAFILNVLAGGMPWRRRQRGTGCGKVFFAAPRLREGIESIRWCEA